jgi:hypothetical protein
VAVLEREPHAVVPFDRGAHRGAGHPAQPLPAGGLVRRLQLVIKTKTIAD